MAADVALKLLAFLGFVALVGGSTYATYQFVNPEGFTPRGIVLDAIDGRVAIAPGQAGSVGVLVRNTGATAESVTVTLRGSDVLAAATPGTPLTIPPGEESAQLVALPLLASAAPGEHAIVVEAATTAEPVKRVTETIRVTVLAPGAAGLGEQQRATVLYVGRLADGSLFNTNHPSFAEAPLPRADFYRASPGNLTIQTGLLSNPTDSGANVIPGFWKGMLGMQKGETRTITIPPADGYGPKTLRETVDRETTLERRFEIEVRELPRPFASFAEHVRTTGQGNASDYDVGSTFTLREGSNVWTFRITAMDATTVTYVPAPPVGAKFTLPSAPAWPNASVVESVNESVIVFYTTPTTEPGETFSFFPYWPDASEVARLTADEIVVRHSPAVGLQYSPGGEAGQAAYVVESVNESGIVVTTESPNPLAGETLVFDVTVLELLGAPT